MAHSPVRTVCRFLGSLGYKPSFIYYYNRMETVGNLEVIHLWVLRVPKNLGALRGVPKLGTSD
jgi:hypothetical protein